MFELLFLLCAGIGALVAPYPYFAVRAVWTDGVRDTMWGNASDQQIRELIQDKKFGEARDLIFQSHGQSSRFTESNLSRAAFSKVPFFWGNDDIPWRRAHEMRLDQAKHTYVRDMKVAYLNAVANGKMPSAAAQEFGGDGRWDSIYGDDRTYVLSELEPTALSYVVLNSASVETRREALSRFIAASSRTERKLDAAFVQKVAMRDKSNPDICKMLSESLSDVVFAETILMDGNYDESLMVAAAKLAQDENVLAFATTNNAFASVRTVTCHKTTDDAALKVTALDTALEIAIRHAAAQRIRSERARVVVLLKAEQKDVVKGLLAEWVSGIQRKNLLGIAKWAALASVRKDAALRIEAEDDIFDVLLVAKDKPIVDCLASKVKDASLKQRLLQQAASPYLRNVMRQYVEDVSSFEDEFPFGEKKVENVPSVVAEFAIWSNVVARTRNQRLLKRVLKECKNDQLREAAISRIGDYDFLVKYYHEEGVPDALQRKIYASVDKAHQEKIDAETMRRMELAKREAEAKAEAERQAEIARIAKESAREERRERRMSGSAYKLLEKTYNSYLDRYGWTEVVFGEYGDDFWYLQLSDGSYPDTEIRYHRGVGYLQYSRWLSGDLAGRLIKARIRMYEIENGDD